jgi:hypothetical protein
LAVGRNGGIIQNAQPFRGWARQKVGLGGQAIQDGGDGLVMNGWGGLRVLIMQKQKKESIGPGQINSQSLGLLLDCIGIGNGIG